MIVEHITAQTGHSLDRDTNTILPGVMPQLLILQTLGLGRHTIDLPKTKLGIRVTIAEEGAIFDIFKGKPENILYMNICCFAKESQGLMYPMVVSMVNRLPLLKGSKLVRPKREHWLYSMPVAPFVGTKEDNMTAGITEFPIWYALYDNPNITVDRL